MLKRLGFDYKKNFKNHLDLRFKVSKRNGYMGMKIRLLAGAMICAPLLLPFEMPAAMAETPNTTSRPAASSSASSGASSSATSGAPAAESNGGTTGSVYIKIGDAALKRSQMAIPAFQYSGSAANAHAIRVGKELFDVFSKDMEISDYFEIQKQGAFLEDTSKVGLKPAAPGETGGFSYTSWKQIGTEFLVRVGYRVTGDELVADTYTYYVTEQRLILGKTYKASVRDVRTVAHTFANDLVHALTGEKGMFLSKLVTSRSTVPGQKEIFVMDWDGANVKQISNHKTIAQSPTWSPDGKSIAYSAFAFHANEKSRNLDMFTYNLTTGRRSLVSYRSGINSGASYMPDGKNLLLTLSNGGNPDIYKMTIDGRTLTKLTNGRSGDLNVEPAPSADGAKIAFSSNRNERPHIFVMNSDGSSPKQITFAGVYNSTPAFSPDGKRIAFAGYESSHFDIFVMDADGTNMIRLTSDAKSSGKMSNNEDPTFAPDGRHILFRSDRTGHYQLYVVNMGGKNEEHRITFDSRDYYKPRWSPSFE